MRDGRGSSEYQMAAVALASSGVGGGVGVVLVFLVNPPWVGAIIAAACFLGIAGIVVGYSHSRAKVKQAVEASKPMSVANKPVSRVV